MLSPGTNRKPLCGTNNFAYVCATRANLLERHNRSVVLVLTVHQPVFDFTAVSGVYDLCQAGICNTAKSVLLSPDCHYFRYSAFI